VSLAGSVAIVTGASRGIGKAYCLALAAAGATVVAAARSETPGRLPGTIHETVEQVRQRGGEAVAIPCDLATVEGGPNLVAETIRRFGRLDFIINNAARIEHRPVPEITPRSWDASFAVNVRAPFLISQAALPLMIQQGRGYIVNIHSDVAWRTTQTAALGGLQLMYATTKAALVRLTTYLADCYRDQPVAIVGLSPGGVVTELVESLIPPERRTGAVNWKPCTPEVVGPPLLWILQQPPAAVTGQLFHADRFGSEWGPGTA
jgi:dehydrogenase/reductase SDR family protein 1